MLEYLPKIFFAIIYIMNAMFFAFIVYLTYTHKFFYLDAAIYIQLMVFYGILLIIHAFGSYMYDRTLEILNYEAEDFDFDDDEELI